MDAANVNRVIGTRLTEAREKVGLGKVDIADRMQITKGGYTPWERGEHPYTVEEVFKLSRILGVTPQWLMGLEGGLNEDEDMIVAAFRQITIPGLRRLAVDQVRAIAGATVGSA